MRIWSGLLSLTLLITLAAGLGAAWFFLAVSLNDMPLRNIALLVAACLAPAVGLISWMLTGARTAGASAFLVVAAVAGAASSATLWFLASDF